MEHGIDYLELPATDLAATKAFYTEAFGWSWTDYGPTYAANGGAPVEIALNGTARPGARHEPGAENAVGPFALLRSDDLGATERSVRDAGGEIVTGPYAYPGGRRFHFADPSGNVLGVYQPDD